LILPFVHGFVLALGLIVVLGPQNMFVFSEGASRTRFREALPVVLTAALSDTALISAAVLGVSVAVLSLSPMKIALTLGGMGFLIYLGWSNWRQTPAVDGEWRRAAEGTLRRRILFALSVSLLNPGAILDTIGVIGTGSLAYHGAAKVAFTLASIMVSWLWFASLSAAGRAFGKLDTVRTHLGRLSALVMWASALYLGYELLFGL